MTTTKKNFDIKKYDSKIKKFILNYIEQNGSKYDRLRYLLLLELNKKVVNEINNINSGLNIKLLS